MRKYEVMVILDPDLEERTVQPSLETFLNVVRGEGGTVDNVDIWGRRRLAYEINKSLMASTSSLISTARSRPSRNSIVSYPSMKQCCVPK